MLKHKKTNSLKKPFKEASLKGFCNYKNNFRFRLLPLLSQ